MFLYPFIDTCAFNVNSHVYVDLLSVSEDAIYGVLAD